MSERLCRYTPDGVCVCTCTYGGHSLLKIFASNAGKFYAAHHLNRRLFNWKKNAHIVRTIHLVDNFPFFFFTRIVSSFLLCVMCYGITKWLYGFFMRSFKCYFKCLFFRPLLFSKELWQIWILCSFCKTNKNSNNIIYS